MNNDQKQESSKKRGVDQTSFLPQVRSLLFLVVIFFINYIARVILAPLMPAIEVDLGVWHKEAGSFFFLLSMGYCLMMLLSGFISSRLNHKKTIILSSTAAGIALMMIGLSPHLWEIRFWLFILGMAAGLYLPSGIATLMGLVSSEHLGKAVAIHELAPSLGGVVAPLLVEVLLGLWSWRGILILLGVISILVGVLFAFFGKGGGFSGEAPSFRTLRNISVEPSFWIMMILFALGIGSSFGVYSMLPLYLVSERGMERTWANTLLALSRVSTPVIVLLSGWVTDRLGVKKTLKAVFFGTGLVTALLSVVPGSWIILIIFLQPMFSHSFFPAGFAALSRMGSPNIRKVSVSLTIPISSLLGSGAIPAGIGFIGEVGSFSIGFTLLGVSILVGAILVRYLKFDDH